MFAGRLKGSTRNDGLLCSYGGLKELKGSNRNDGRLCSSGGVKELYYVHPVQSWWSIAILALAVGKRTGLLVGVRYIYLRKNVELWWGVEDCSSSTFPRYERRNLN